jgi:hypothetical protein
LHILDKHAGETTKKEEDVGETLVETKEEFIERE